MLHIASEGMGSWFYDKSIQLLTHTFPNTQIIPDNAEKPDLIIRSHFLNIEKELPFDCPYITVSGESYDVYQRTYEPIIEIKTRYCTNENSIYIFHIW